MAFTPVIGPTVTNVYDKVIQNLDPVDTVNFGHVDYLHYVGSTLVSSYDPSAAGGNLRLFQKIAADYVTSDFGTADGGPAGVISQQGGSIKLPAGTANSAFVTQAAGESGGEVNFVYLDATGTDMLGSYQNPVHVPKVIGESYFLPLSSAAAVEGNANTGVATMHTPDITLVSQELNGTIDLLGYDITEHGPGGAGTSGGGVVTLVASDEVTFAANTAGATAPIGNVVGVADTNQGTIIVAQDAAGHVEFMHLTDVGTPAGGVPHYEVDSFYITEESYAPITEVNPNGPTNGTGFTQLDLVTTSTGTNTFGTGSVTQIHEIFYNLTYSGTTADATNGTAASFTAHDFAGTIVEQNALFPGWEVIDGGMVAAGHFGDPTAFVFAV